jgi:hypothetical protein
MNLSNTMMLSAGEGWGEGNKPHHSRLDASPLPRSTTTITKVHIAGEGTDRAAFLPLRLKRASTSQ